MASTHREGAVVIHEGWRVVRYETGTAPAPVTPRAPAPVEPVPVPIVPEAAPEPEPKPAPVAPVIPASKKKSARKATKR